MDLPLEYYNDRKLEHLVENRTIYTVDSAELNVFETHHVAEQVVLQFDHPVFVSMISGKKVMYLRDQEPFDLLPGSSLIMPANEVMCIDFPIATMNDPTRCLAMAISPDKIQRVVTDLNIEVPKADKKEWKLNDNNFAFTNDAAIAQIIERLVYLFMEDHTSKDLFVDMMLKELLVRVLQTENRNFICQNCLELSTNNRMAAVVKHIQQNLHQDLSVDQLSHIACMSPSNFHKVFRNELGLSPVQYINTERLKMAAHMLNDPKVQIKEVYMACGFNNLSYFIRAFKRSFALTPGEYQYHVARKLLS